MKRAFLFILLITTYIGLNAQQYGIIYGTIRDTLNKPIDLANVAILNSRVGTMTNANGKYEIEVPSNEVFEVMISCVGYMPQAHKLIINAGEKKNFDVYLKQDIKHFKEISVSARKERASTFQNIDVNDLDYMVTAGNKIEAIIMSQAGVASNNELSSQYSVRGGNFDENLVYVNDIEIYRPFLVRSGQQEGLSFINSDLVSSIRFSAGGFDAKYGDKMSSALDITYKRPSEFAGSASVSLLGASAHIEGANKNKRLSYLAGYRYKTTSYLLNTLDVSGDYKPQFSDFQTMISYRFSNKVELTFLGNYSSNEYQFIPDYGEVEFGTNDLPFEMNIYYEGQEEDHFDTYLGALSLNITPNENLSLKFIANAFQTSEQVSYDILGEYSINQLDNSIGSETYGDSILNIGVGGFLEHARNYLDAYVLSGSHLGSYKQNSHHLQWGFKYQYQSFIDRVSQWNIVDSAGYSIPYDGSQIIPDDYTMGYNPIAYFLANAFIQDTWEIKGEKADYFATLGLRSSLWNFNKTFMLSPRATISMQPKWNKDMMFHVSAGVYYQPPFFKELKNPNNEINYDIKPQKSTHLLIGGDYIFSSWDRPFKLTAEIYYKWLEDLIPYKIDNLSLKYAGENMASGYAKGLDLKLNGEFVPGAESWFTASFMRSKEDIVGDSALFWINEDEQVLDEAGYYSRPNEQIFSAGAYFQDHFPNNPDYKVQLSGFFATGLPLSHPGEQYYTTYRMPSYKRVDLGFSKVLKRENQQLKDRNPFRYFNNIWLSAEVFNLLGIDNRASYSWIRTVSNQEGVPNTLAVPNNLTGRRFNLKITAEF